MNTRTAKSASSPWRWMFAITALQAILAVVALAEIPGDAGRPSAQRLVLLTLPAVLALFAALLAIRSVNIPGPSPRLALGAAALAVLSGAAAFLLRYLQPAELSPYYVRLAPILVLCMALGVEYALFFTALHRGLHSGEVLAELRRWKAAAVSLAILLVLAGVVAITRLGVQPDPAYWGEPGVPVMGWQLAVVLLGGLAVFLVLPRVSPIRGRDALIAALLWLVAMGVWLAVPMDVMRNSFYAPIGPPAGQPFPNSDAAYYDSMAQSLLVGYPYQGQIPTRPLYVVLLAFLHLLFDERYAWIIAGQTALLALIPVTLFLLAARLHSRLAGIVVALIGVCREWTTLLVSSQTRVSNTKTLLVDLPTLLLILLAALAVLSWLNRRSPRSAAIAGGTFGLLLLLRTQAFAILPPVVILAAVVIGLRSRRFWLSSAAFAGMLGLTILPWLLHNYFIFGTLSFDAPFQARIIASQYRFTGNLDINNVDLQGAGLASTVLAFTIQNPGFVFGFIANHFMATEIGGLLALPWIAPYNGLLAPLNIYWMDWTSHLSGPNILLVLLYLVFIAVGLGASWRRWRWIGLVPLIFSLGYALANGLGRFSGWRYDLPADWVAYFYFGIGVAEVLRLIGLLFGSSYSEPDASPSNVRRPRSGSMPWLPLLGFIVIGSLPWLAQSFAGPRYPNSTPAGLVARVASAASVQSLGLDGDAVRQFAAQPQAQIQVGLVLYPRFFTRDDGLASAHPWPAYAPRSYPRLGFVLLNQTMYDVVFPSREAQSAVAHGADAIVIGCDEGDHIEARLVFVPASGVAASTESPMQKCP